MATAKKLNVCVNWIWQDEEADAGYSNLASLCSTGNSRSENSIPGTVITHGQER
jgi:hypothetical protein